MRRFRFGFGWRGFVVAGVAVCFLSFPGAVIAGTTEEEGSKSADSAVEPGPVHQVDELEQAVLDAIRSFLREDRERALDAINRVEKYSRPLQRGPDDDKYTREVVNYDQAFHVVIGHSREFAERGDLKNSFNQFVWVQRTCVECHDLSRKAGILPDDGKPLRSGDR